MMSLSKKKVVAGLLVVGLLCGATGAYAGKVMERYKTPRNTIATVEAENVHKNRIAITVNDKAVKVDTVYFNGVTYAPIREVATMLNAGVNYNSTTMSADIFTENELLDLFGITLHKEYLGGYAGWRNRVFKMDTFNPSSNEFTGTWHSNNIKGYLTESKMVLRFGTGTQYELIFNGATNTFVSADGRTFIKIE